MTRTQDLRIVGISWLVSSRYSSRLPPNSLGWPPPILTLDLPIRLLLMKSRMYSVQHIILSYQSNQSVWNSHILIQLSFGKFSCEIKVANSWLEQNRFSLTTFFWPNHFCSFSREIKVQNRRILTDQLFSSYSRQIKVVNS